MSKKRSNPPPPVNACKPPPPTSPPPVRARRRRLLPILRNHDPADVLGVLEGTVIVFTPGKITLDELRELSGGYRLLESETRDGVDYVRRAELLCLSTIVTRKEPAMPQPDPVRLHLAWLGRRVREKVTGAQGVITSVSFDLYGCVHGLVSFPQPTDGPQGKEPPDSRWYDVQRLEDTSPTEGRVLEPPDYFVRPPGTEAGPEDKPIP